jgi:hypothetical protein
MALWRSPMPTTSRRLSSCPANDRPRPRPAPRTAPPEARRRAARRRPPPQARRCQAHVAHSPPRSTTRRGWPGPGPGPVHRRRRRDIHHRAHHAGQRATAHLVRPIPARSRAVLNYLSLRAGRAPRDRRHHELADSGLGSSH